MIWVLLWVFVGLATATCWVYIDVTQDDTSYNLKQLLGITAIAAVFGPIIVGLFIQDRYKDQIAKFFNNPVIGRKK